MNKFTLLEDAKLEELEEKWNKKWKKKWVGF